MTAPTAQPLDAARFEARRQEINEQLAAAKIRVAALSHRTASSELREDFFATTSAPPSPVLLAQLRDAEKEVERLERLKVAANDIGSEIRKGEAHRVVVAALARAPMAYASLDQKVDALLAWLIAGVRILEEYGDEHAEVIQLQVRSAQEILGVGQGPTLHAPTIAGMVDLVASIAAIPDAVKRPSEWNIRRIKEPLNRVLKAQKTPGELAKARTGLFAEMRRQADESLDRTKRASE